MSRLHQHSADLPHPTSFCRYGRKPVSPLRLLDILLRRKRPERIPQDHSQRRNQSGSLGNPTLQHVATICETNIRPYGSKGDQPPRARDDEGVSGVIEMKISEDWMQLKKEVDRIWRDYSCHPKDQPNPQMCRLLILGEDHRFRYHPGFDPIALCRAAWRTTLCGRKEGGSTIAMQLVRVLTRRYDANILRKTREIALAVRLTQYVPRRYLPGLYLWVAYYGWRMNNLLEACNRMEINPTSADIYSAAKLVARLKYPEPRLASAERLNTIEQRCAYLLARYYRSDETYSLIPEACNEAV